MKSTTGTCQLCKTENIALTKAYLISKAQVKAACSSDNDTKTNNIQTLNDRLLGGTAYRNGWVDYILCAKCNNVELSKHEKTFSDFLKIHRNFFDSKIEDNVNNLLQKRSLKPDDLYRHLKLAILSFFWLIASAKVRHISRETINFFKESISATDLENIRQMILEDNAGSKTQYPVQISYEVPTKSISTADESADVTSDKEIIVYAITIDSDPAPRVRPGISRDY